MLAVGKPRWRQLFQTRGTWHPPRLTQRPRTIYDVKSSDVYETDQPFGVNLQSSRRINRSLSAYRKAIITGYRIVENRGAISTGTCRDFNYGITVIHKCTAVPSRTFGGTMAWMPIFDRWFECADIRQMTFPPILIPLARKGKIHARLGWLRGRRDFRGAGARSRRINGHALLRTWESPIHDKFAAFDG